jgi:plastocyanin
VIQVDAQPDGSLRFVQTSLSAAPGPITLRFTNASGVSHSIGIRDGTTAGPTMAVSGGATVTLDVDLGPGTYEVYCGVDSHATFGMHIPFVVS